jgi:hypothetical protein
LSFGIWLLEFGFICGMMVSIKLWCLVWCTCGHSRGVDRYMLSIRPRYVEGRSFCDVPWYRGFRKFVSFLPLWSCRASAYFICACCQTSYYRVKIHEFSGACFESTDYSCSFLVGVGTRILIFFALRPQISTKTGSLRFGIK